MCHLLRKKGPYNFTHFSPIFYHLPPLPGPVNLFFMRCLTTEENLLRGTIPQLQHILLCTCVCVCVRESFLGKSLFSGSSIYCHCSTTFPLLAKQAKVKSFVCCFGEKPLEVVIVREINTERDEKVYVLIGFLSMAS